MAALSLCERSSVLFLALPKIDEARFSFTFDLDPWGELCFFFLEKINLGSIEFLVACGAGAGRRFFA